MLSFLKNKEIFNRLFLTLVLLFSFRVISQLPVPYTDPKALSDFAGNSLIQYMGAFTGGALTNFTVMAMGISSYISASIVIQMLTFQVPLFHQIAKSPTGKQVIQRMTIVLGVGISFFSSLAAVSYANKSFGILTKDTKEIFLLIACIHAIGTGIAIYMGEMITERGFGNGFSLLIFSNILSQMPQLVSQNQKLYENGEITSFQIGGGIVLIFSVICLVTFAERSLLNIPIVYAKGRRNRIKNFYSAENAMPIKLNIAGVMPIILSTTVFQILFFFLKKKPEMMRYFSEGSIPYFLLSSLFIFFFSIVYTNLLLSEQELSESIQGNGAMIKGVRPGKDTTSYIRDVKKALGFISGIYLMFLSFVPAVLMQKLRVQMLPPTSFMILTGVALEVCRSLKTEYDLLNYRKI